LNKSGIGNFEFLKEELLKMKLVWEMFNEIKRENGELMLRGKERRKEEKCLLYY
jgi:hypothetical protein